MFNNSKGTEAAKNQPKKGREFESMPFFLSDEFKSILEDKIRGTGGPSDGTDGLGGTSGLGGTGMVNQLYKSGFLKDKIVE